MTMARTHDLPQPSHTQPAIMDHNPDVLTTRSRCSTRFYQPEPAQNHLQKSSMSTAIPHYDPKALPCRIHSQIIRSMYVETLFCFKFCGSVYSSLAEIVREVLTTPLAPPVNFTFRFHDGKVFSFPHNFEPANGCQFCIFGTVKTIYSGYVYFTYHLSPNVIGID